MGPAGVSLILPLQFPAMEDTAAAVEEEAFIDAETLNIDTSTRRYYGTADSSTSSPTRIGEDDCISASSETSATRAKQNYTIVAHETSPLLPKHEHMSAQFQSPIEIVGIEGADGQRRPWLRALETKKIPWWETPSVSCILNPFEYNYLYWLRAHRYSGSYHPSLFIAWPWAPSLFQS